MNGILGQRGLFAALVAAGLALSSPAAAFGTTNAFGQSAEHEKITRLALAGQGFQPRSLDMLAGKTGTFGAVGAPDRPDRGLLSHAPAHCDGGDHLDVAGYPQGKAAAMAALAACRAWIFGQTEAAVREAGALLGADGRIDDSEIPTHVPCVFNGRPGRAKCNLLESLGLAFHAAQDFYAHTNWSDIPAAGPITLENPPGLGQARPAGWIDPRRRAAFPAGLISGCYEGIPEALHCKGRVRHRDLNKDTGRIDLRRGTIGAGTTPRGAVNGNFARAVTAAVDDTRARWAHFEDRVLETYGAGPGGRILCAIRHDDPARTCR